MREGRLASLVARRLHLDLFRHDPSECRNKEWKEVTEVKEVLEIAEFAKPKRPSAQMLRAASAPGLPSVPGAPPAGSAQKPLLPRQALETIPTTGRSEVRLTPVIPPGALETKPMMSRIDDETEIPRQLFHEMCSLAEQVRGQHVRKRVDGKPTLVRFDVKWNAGSR